MMAVATRTDYWDARLNGDNPVSPTDTSLNEVWTKTGSGSPAASGGAWRVSDNDYHITPTTTAYTLFTCFNYNSTPNNGEVIMFLDNGTHSVQVQVAAGGTFSLVGATTATSPDLDPDMTDEEPVPLILRLTLTSAGVATLYYREIIEDDDATDLFLQVNGTNDSSGVKKIQWGNNTGTIDWQNVYASTFGAFSPDEMMESAFGSQTLLQMGIETVNVLKDSKRTFIKNYVSDSAILYGYDLSSDMISRVYPPSIHVVLKNLTSPQFDALGGVRIEQMFDVVIYVTTRGTDYKNAYRLGINIMGDVFDELYSATGTSPNDNSLNAYTAEFDTKMDNDEVVCVHILTLTYRRLLSMLSR
tara:strand:- start:2988 stop:4061 length:1074 start_codon:yes stop_codon:yes gene_type:complete